METLFLSIFGCFASTAKALYASKENIQIHGGVGFTWEYDCHLFYRRSKQLALNIGSIRQWKENLISNLEKRNIVV